MQVSKILTAALVLGAASFTALPAATAAPLMPNVAISDAAKAAEPVQFRHRGGGWRQGGFNRGYRGYNRGYRGYNRGYGRGYGIGPAIGGLAAGAIIGGAIANSQAQASGNAVAYCSQRFKSYDPASGTYLGYDGNRHACP